MIPVRVALGQFNATVGDLAGNVAKMKEMWQQAVAAEAVLVLCPELAVCGYPPEDLVYKKQFVRDNRAALEDLAAACAQKTVAVGFVESADGRLFNAAAVIQKGRIVHTYRKGMLPNYSVFDEQRYFQPGEHPLVISVKGLRVALTICEDLWHPEWLSRFLMNAGRFHLLVNISASPFHVGKIVTRGELISKCTDAFDCAVAYCNLVGGQDELVFDGHSIVADSTGRIVAEAKAFDEDLLLADLLETSEETACSVPVRAFVSRASCPRVSKASGLRIEGQRPSPRAGGTPATQITPDGVTANGPAPQPADVIQEVYLALVLGTRDYALKNGFRQVLLGTSGGIDSAVTAAVAAAALGPENVRCVTMPSRFNSPDTIADSKLVAENLGCPLLAVPIEPILTPFHESLKADPAWNDQGLAYENLQARIRGMILMSLSNQTGALVLTTGNKSEVSVGYSTLYGDSAGGFGVIKDVPKTMVYQLARYINERAGREVIPEAVITRIPSAELRPNQKDSDSLPEYDLLDRIIAGYVEQDLSARELVDSGLPAETVERVIRMIDRNEYKRRQSAPGVRITSKAFGKDRRLPITNRYTTTVNGRDRK